MANERIAERFFEKTIPVTESGCLIWLGACNNKGYGQFWTGERNELAHRFACRLAGRHLADDELGLHTCDIPCCVNEKHVFAGDHKANSADMFAKGRNGGNFEFQEVCDRGHNNWRWVKNGQKQRRVCVDCRNDAAVARYYRVGKVQRQKRTGATPRVFKATR
jgi:hypothetical protein